ncbi:hypothetical protein MMC17_005835 [Xylographa soralifera]|nr:hypothetical protein [Xylographa soralifera]
MTSAPTNESLSKDAMFIFQVFKFSEGKPKINWTKVAEATSLKNAKVASTRYSQIMKKHGLGSSSAASEPSTPSASATKGNKRKAATTPASGAKRARKGASAFKVPNNIDDDEIADDEKECIKVKTEDDPEAGFTGEHELEEKDTALDSDIDPLHLLKEEMENEDAAAAAQDYEY